MMRFRPLTHDAPTGSVDDLLAVGEMIDDVMNPRHFLVDPALRLDWIAARAETIPWEIFQGRLVDAAHTRQTATFLSWHVFDTDTTHGPVEPMVSVKLDVADRRIHVVRGLLAYVWTPRTVGNVIESEEAVRWMRELVGTIALDDFASLEPLRDELICTIWQAVVGTSRLPLHSVEAPLPGYLFGQLHYVYAPWRQDSDLANESATQIMEGLRESLAWPEKVKLIEFALRRGAIDELVEHVAHLPLPRVLRAMFQAVSLSPYTSFVDHALAFIDRAVERGRMSADERIDFLSWLLRQLARHLTAYDLVTFHYRGANYPDALLLDAALRAYLREIERDADAFLGDAARMRRRALRQACLLRRHYEGHLVPDAPTSPGENARVLPASHPRVPEEQLAQTLRRRRELYANEPISKLLGPNARRVFEASMRDLVHMDEQMELGIGVFIDRPLGYLKAAAEPDQTPMLAHEAFSLSLTKRRRDELQALCGELELSVEVPAVEVTVSGLSHEAVAACPRPVVALSDVRKVSGDFVILRTLPGGMATLIEQLDWRPVRHLLEESRIRLWIPARNENGESVIDVYDESLHRRLRLVVDTSEGYVTRAGIEMPRAGLRVVDGSLHLRITKARKDESTK